MLHLIQSISAVRLYLPKDLRPLDNRQGVGKSIQEVEKRFPDGVPLLDPVEDLGIKEKSMKDVVKKIEAFEHRLFSHPLTKDPNLEEYYNMYEKKNKVANEVKAIKAELKKKRSLLQMDELKCRKRVLRRMGYCNASDVIELKGRVACEISSGDELMTTELLFNGVFNDLTPQQASALLSCFVFEEKSGETPKLTEQLAGPLRTLQDTARRIARVSKEAKLEIDEETYVDKFKPQMMDVVNAWCNGSSFFEICKMTDIFEGSVIRCMRRLEETLRQMVQAAKAIGNTELENKFNEENETNCFKIEKMILERKFAPVIVFSFSKKDCEAYAMQMPKLDFNTDEEKDLVQEVFNNAIDALSDEDKKLPQVGHVLPLLKKGIGIHHGGLLPLLKATIEILFSEGLIKALFATETFAMGLNMPARTVLFTSARKFDGRDFRWLTSGEYIQMSGRAGRRGLDDRGIVILMIDEKMPPETGKLVLKGAPEPLISAFHLTYNMVLYLLRVEEINPEYMLERSFYQFQNYAAIPDLCEKLKKTEEQYNNVVVPNEDQVSSYYKIRQQLDNLSKDLLSFIQKPQYILPFLQPERLVQVKNGEDDFGWGMVVNFQKKANQSKMTDAGPVYVAEVLVNMTKESAKSRNTAVVKPSPPGVLGEMQVIPVMLHLIQSISAVRLYLPKDLRPLDNRQGVGKSIQEVEKRFPDGVPLLDPVEDLGIKEKSMKDVVKKIEAFEHRLFSHPLTKDPNLEEYYNMYEKKNKVANEVKAIKAELKKKRSLLQMDELKCRKRVLRRMGYCNASDVIELKGRVACEISSGDELMTTELLFNGVFNDLTPQQASALLSCFVFEEKSGETPKLTEQLAGPLRTLQDTARRIARVSKEAKLEIDEETYVDKFKPQMMDVVNAWCNGSSFFEICKMTDIFEGSVIRCMRRLEETLRQMVQAAKAIGNTELENKFNEENETNCFKIEKMILERKFAPVIVFSFSKKYCEAYAMQMPKLDFNTDEEKDLVQEVFNNAIDALSDEDKKLPEVEHVLPLLKKGIGIHHGGLLPLLKETIEILFSEGLIKALFATETFAMGLNMPARTVLFTSARKFDGRDFRWLTSGEYIQMSGRAGRRGLDDRGIVILMIDEKMPPEAGKLVLKGSPDPLNSAFHLTYNMVLNLLRVEEINPEYMLERSFYQFQNYAAIPDLCEKLKKTEEQYNNVVVPNKDQVSSYYKIRQQLDNLSKDLLSFIQKPQYILPFLQPGRLVQVKNGEDDFGWGMVVNFQKKANQSKMTDTGPVYVAEVLVNMTKESAKSRNTAVVKPSPPGVLGEMQVIPVMLHLIQSISAVRLYLPKDLRPLDNRQGVGKSIQEVEKRFPDGVPLLDPVEDLGIKEKSMKDVVKKIEAFEHRLFSHPLTKDPNLEEYYNMYEKKNKVANEVKAIKAELKKKRSLLQMDELKCRKRVLRRMGYCNASDVIELKGRVACEISSGDELMTTELLFNGVFNDLTPQQASALLSCFVFEEKSGETPKLTEQLAGPLRTLQDTARRIARVSKEAKLEIDEETYVDKFKPQMMDVVNAWCNGSSFFEICKMTDIFEGSVIRCMRRLEETLRQMVQAAKAIGNTELENKFNEGIRSMKRDIIFAASLYL